tara:strand:- start:645 stop:791 length:147 start_codon:yes stop_codon:yes gene_type:complete
MPHAGHITPLENPVSVNAALTGWLVRPHCRCVTFKKLMAKIIYYNLIL